ncbi:hypothetical protein RO575_22630 [Methylomonas sp. MO1]|uniref:hypothetical protein n=1 Tax=Methylomonas sp. MO1 TaxID=3073619 RepID=UPI0028A575C7|nr:hypothetical protein [Methylomonas sp. MO1]MDT4292372.1 hypothetical protein [Methylomonas sp. MO1]
MHIHIRAAFMLLTLSVVTPTLARPPLAIIDSAQQTARDAEKLTILQAELTEQKQIATSLQQNRALHLASGDKSELDKTEARLEEVNSNISQLQQEIDLAQGKTKDIKTVVVKPIAAPKQEDVKTAQNGQPQPVTAAGPWWDLYNRQGRRQ